jgi:Ca-activated chloride channel family protein
VISLPAAFIIQHSSFPTAFIWPLKLEYFSGAIAAFIFLAFAAFFVTLGLRSLAGLGRARKWTAILVRLAVTLCFILILGGARWHRQHKDVEVIVCSDISESIDQFTSFSGESYDAARDKYLLAATQQKDKKPGDRIGVISFADDAWIDAIPGTELIQNAKPIHEKRVSGTDIGSALQLSLSTFRNDAMRRIVLITDGNQNLGDVDAAVSAAAAQHVPIDVFPLNYRIRNEVLMDKMIAPTWKRENEPFTVEVFLRSTNKTDVAGKLTVLMDNVPIALDPAKPAEISKAVTIKPGVTPFAVHIPGLTQAGAHRFKATFSGNSEGNGKVDTLLSNNSGEAFTFVRGKGQVLYIDNARDRNDQVGPGTLLATALASEGINLVTKRVEQFPNDLVELQNYDAVILANVPKGGGFGGLDEKQDEYLARYVHDMGGGLVMIGGPDTFGAGGWIGSKLSEVLPVNLEIPAQRQIPKGALVLIMHSCEMPNGTGEYWGEQCALAAIKALGPKDEIGVISYGWNNGAAGGVGGAGWDFTLKEKYDGSAVTKAIKNMMLGDMPSFDDAVTLAVKGAGPGQPSLLNSNARQRHIIIISDGDPGAANQSLLDLCVKEKISISTVTIYTHIPGTKSPQMIQMAEKTKGKAYGPVENNPNQLPQIFIKEATVVQRSLIKETEEDKPPFSVNISDASSDLVKGIGNFPPLRGMVLTSRKDNAQNDIKMALVVPTIGQDGKQVTDPVLAHWQTGLGRAVVFAGDATARWAPQWAGSSMFSKFWAQAVRSVARPPMSTDFDVQTMQVGTKGKIIVKANSQDSGFLNFMNIRGTILGPDAQPAQVKLVQTGPGTYEADFDAPQEGNYVIPLHFEGKDGGGELMGGLTINGAPEQRDLQSNDALLQRIADATGGRMLTPFDAEGAELFTRQGLLVSASPLPIWDILIPILLGLMIIDVAVRRIAWDWMATKKLAAAMAQKVRDYTTTTRAVESAPTMDALKRVREDVAEQKFRPAEKGAAAASSPLPDPKAKFVPKDAVEGDISSVVGGATDKPLPSTPKKDVPATGATGVTNSLLEAKKRAQQQIKQKEQGE